MTYKLSPAMVTAITDAYRTYRDGHRPDYHGTNIIVPGLKANTASALEKRNLIKLAQVGAFKEWVLTVDGIKAAREILGITPGQTGEDDMPAVVVKGDTTRVTVADPITETATTVVLSAPMVTGLREAFRQYSYPTGVVTGTLVALIDRNLITTGPGHRLTPLGLRVAYALMDAMTGEPTDGTKAERAASFYFACATSEDNRLAWCESPVYQRARQALMDAITVAYPNVDAAEVYDVFSDCNESIAYCANYVRDQAYQATVQAMIDAGEPIQTGDLRIVVSHGHLAEEISAVEIIWPSDGVMHYRASLRHDWQRVDGDVSGWYVAGTDPHEDMDDEAFAAATLDAYVDAANTRYAAGMDTEEIIATVDIPATIARMTPAQREALFLSAVDQDGHLMRDEDGYGSSWIRGGVATTNALRDLGMVERRPRGYGHAYCVTPVGLMVAAEMIRQGATHASVRQDVRDARAAMPINQAITRYGDLITRVRGAVDNPTGDHVTGDTPVGTVCVIASRGSWRRGVLVAVGRSNATVAYTTDGAFRERPDAPYVTTKADKMERVWIDRTASMIHVGTFRESCLSHGCPGCPSTEHTERAELVSDMQRLAAHTARRSGRTDIATDTDDAYPPIHPADLVPQDVALADTDAIDAVERDAVQAMIDAERADEMDDMADTHDHHHPRMMAVPRAISPLSERERKARKARRRAQRQARKIARRARRASH